MLYNPSCKMHSVVYNHSISADRRFKDLLVLSSEGIGLPAGENGLGLRDTTNLCVRLSRGHPVGFYVLSYWRRVIHAAQAAISTLVSRGVSRSSLLIGLFADLSLRWAMGKGSGWQLACRQYEGPYGACIPRPDPLFSGG